MSYRNPQIIQDRSGEILAEGIKSFGASVAQGITTRGERLRKEREKRELENKQYNKDLILLSNKKAEDASLFNEGIKGVGESMRQELLKANEASLQRIYEIKKLQLSGNADPALSDELAREKMKIQGYNEMAETGIAQTAVLAELVENWDEGGSTIFLNNGPDGTDAESKAFAFGFGGHKDYESGFRWENGEMVAFAKKKGEGNKEYVIPRSGFTQRMNSLTREMDNMQVNVSDEVGSKVFDEGGAGSNFNDSIKTRSEYSYQTQKGTGKTMKVQTMFIDNTAKMDEILKETINDVKASLDGVAGNKQELNHYLDSVAATRIVDGKEKVVDADDWLSMTKEERSVLAKKVGDTLFFNRTGLEEKDGQYFKVLESKSVDDQKESYDYILNKFQSKEFSDNKEWASEVSTLMGYGDDEKFVLQEDGSFKVTLKEREEPDLSGMTGTPEEREAEKKRRRETAPFKTKIININRRTLTNRLMKGAGLSYADADTLAAKIMKKKKTN
mgnify:FL=1